MGAERFLSFSSFYSIGEIFMASIVDAFNESLSEDLALVKIAVYAIPTCILANMFIIGKMAQFYFWGSIMGLVILGLLTKGINNVRMNRREILTLSPFELIKVIFKTFVVLVPHIIVFGSLGFFILNNVTIPIDLPHVPLIFSIIVWALLFSIVLTSYLSYSKYLKIPQGYNYKVIAESCIDVLVSCIFYSPQLFIANAILVGPVAYLFFYFGLPFTHWGFVAYCSAIFVMNISMIANFLAQCAYEHIKGNNEEYNDNINVNLIDDISERVNGN